jgi:hypothetical protein
MANGAAFDEPARYRIRVRATLEQERRAWFEGFEMSRQANGDTVLAGLVDDQAALHGLLARISALGLPLISLEREREEHT